MKTPPKKDILRLNAMLDMKAFGLETKPVNAKWTSSKADNGRRQTLLHTAAAAGLMALFSTELFSPLDQVVLFMYVVQLESR